MNTLQEYEVILDITMKLIIIIINMKCKKIKLVRNDV